LDYLPPRESTGRDTHHNHKLRSNLKPWRKFLRRERQLSKKRVVEDRRGTFSCELGKNWLEAKKNYYFKESLSDGCKRKADPTQPGPPPTLTGAGASVRQLHYRTSTVARLTFFLIQNRKSHRKGPKRGGRNLHRIAFLWEGQGGTISRGRRGGEGRCFLLQKQSSGENEIQRSWERRAA